MEYYYDLQIGIRNYDMTVSNNEYRGVEPH